MNEEDQVLSWRIDNSAGEHYNPDVAAYIEVFPR